MTTIRLMPLQLAREVQDFQGSAKPTELRLHPDTYGALLKELTGRATPPPGLTPVFCGAVVLEDPSLLPGQRLWVSGRAGAPPLETQRPEVLELPPLRSAPRVYEAPATWRGWLRRIWRSL